MGRDDRFQSVFLLVLLSVSLISIDLYFDFREDGWTTHITIEAFLLTLISFLWIRMIVQNKRLKDKLHRVQDDLKNWKLENEAHLHELTKAIDRQLDSWGLTQSEKAIAMLLLKGLSAKEIASIRSSAEKTVRQQCTCIYQKSGLAGRSELSAFFLEGLLTTHHA